MTDEVRDPSDETEAGPAEGPAPQLPMIPGLDPETLARSAEIRGVEVHSLGRAWKLAPLGLARSIGRARDALYDNIVIYQEVRVGDVKECAFLMLRANYRLDGDGAIAVIEGADFAELAEAVCDSAFVHELAEEQRSYTGWVRSACLANGIDPAKVEKSDMPAILRQLVATGRAMPLEDFTAAGEFQKLRSSLIEMM